MSHPVCVFLLEDDDELRLTLKKVMELEGYKVVAASDGPEAVTLAEDHVFDIMVLDVKLPGPDGLEVLAQFKRENPELLSVVVTGYATEQDTLRALRLGVGDYLKKPFHSNVLLEALERLSKEVGRRRSLENKEQSSGKLFVWLLEYLVGGLEATETHSGLSFTKIARSALKLALGMGYTNDGAQALQIALLNHYLEQHSGRDDRFSELQSLLPAAALKLSKEFLPEQNTSPETEIQSLADLGSRCLRLAQNPDALEKLEQSTGVNLKLEPTERSGRKRRHLLSLARTFIASGDLEAGKTACQKLAQEGLSTEAGLAQLELARLNWRQGNLKEARSSLKTLVGLLGRLGPQASAELKLEGGLTALAMDLSDGRVLLSQAGTELTTLNLSSEANLAQLSTALAEAKPRPLEKVEVEAATSLSQSSLSRTILTHSEWLLSRLLSWSGEAPELHNLSVRLVRDAPRAVGKLLLSQLEASQSDALLGLIEEGGRVSLAPSLREFVARSQSKSLVQRVEALLHRLETRESQPLSLSSLGPFEVRIGERLVPNSVWRTSRSRFLLALLAAREGNAILSEVVVEQFWPGVSPTSGRKNVSQAVSDLRKVLSEEGFDRADDLIVRKHELLSLAPDLVEWHDLTHFGGYFRSGREAFQAGDMGSAHQFLRQAYSLIRGDYLEDCSMDWALIRRREVDRERQECSESLARACLALERHSELLEIAGRALDYDPCHQNFHLLVMQAYTAMGRSESALRQFERARQALRAELQVEPNTELLKAQQIAKMSL